MEVEKVKALKFFIIVAVDQGDGIGFKNSLPWDLPKEKRYFRQATTSTTDPFKTNAVIIGYKTWLGMAGAKPGPIPGRFTVVLTRDPAHAQEAVAAKCAAAGTLDEALDIIAKRGDVETVWHLGGATLYPQAIQHPACAGGWVTRIEAKFEADVHFHASELEVLYQIEEVGPSQDDNGVKWHVEKWGRKRLPDVKGALTPLAASPDHEEYQYLRLIKDVMADGVQKMTRSGPTYSKWGAMMRFSLRNGTLPLLTTKRVFFKGVAQELFWFISGCTSNTELQKKNVHIWDANATKEFMAKAVPGNTYEEGDLGPVYGFQWRHFGAVYQGMHGDYTGKGVDQLQGIVDLLTKDPNSRRIIMSAWNPSDLDKMALPPCHVLSQYVVNNGEISCLLYQRSGDLGLGVPFNIASYSLLTHLLAYATGLKAAELVHVIGDAHVYANHFDGLRTQLKRQPRQFPKLAIKEGSPKDITKITFEMIEVQGYDPHPTIPMEMSP